MRSPPPDDGVVLAERTGPREDETPVERPGQIGSTSIAGTSTEHLCYLQADTDAVRVWRDGNADDCAVCKLHEEAQSTKDGAR